MIVGYWEGKYKTCRAAFLEMSRYWKREKKEAKKDQQRIIQACRDGIDRVCPMGKKMWSMLNDEEKYAITQFQKILGILKVDGFEGPER